MKPALLLVDLQNDFLEREGLTPRPSRIIERAAELLEGCRELGVPIVHVHTLVRPDGSDRIPHWKRRGTCICVEGTPGSLAPESLRPLGGESVCLKRFFSAFGCETLDETLRDAGIDSLIVAGLYLHGCVRSTVLDAYERGYEVWVAEDAVGSTEPDQAEAARDFLAPRAARFLDTHGVLSLLGKAATPLPRDVGKAATPLPRDVGKAVPWAHLAGAWVAGGDRRVVERRNPSRWSEVLAHVPVASAADVRAAAEAASASLASWRAKTAGRRGEVLLEWGTRLEQRAEELAVLLAVEIGKPISDGRNEIRMGVEFIRNTALRSSEELGSRTRPDARIAVRERGHGLVGIVTPWNNPIAIPVGKIAPALAFGNAVVWKPALEAPRAAMAVVDLLAEAGATPGILSLVFGEEQTARAVVDEPLVKAISLTGSLATGRSVRARCARLGKPLQAELGGNNAAIVLGVFDFQPHLWAFALSAFSFAGQRCTAIRRFIVERAVVDAFQSGLVHAVESLKIGDPLEESTDLGPLVSREHQERVASAISDAVAAGARLACGGKEPPELEPGCWLSPAVLLDARPGSRIAREETFGPVAIVLPVDGLEEAIAVANGVEQGLVAALCAGNASNQKLLEEAVEAGILKLSPGPIAVDSDAPFGGWKSSSDGPPEHGVWDRHFYSRTQAVYP